MSRERELLKEFIDFVDSYEFYPTERNIIWEIVSRTQELLAQPEQQPEAWIIVNKETGYRTQVSDLTPFLYHREIFEVIPLYTAPPKREPLSEDKLDVLAEANITDEGIAGYYLGFRDAEKAHGIGGGE